MKRIFGLLVLLALLSTPAPLRAQSFDYKTRSYVATDFNNWTAYSTTTVAVGAATITIENPWQPTVPGWNVIQPFRVNSVLLMDVGGGAAVEEEVTVTATACTTPVSCTVTGTFANAHSGRWRIKSGTYGAQEAMDFAIDTGAGRVVIPPNFLGVTADVTGLIRGGTGVDVIDQRSGGEIWYGWSGTAYTALFGSSDTFTFAANQQATSTALAATLTTIAPAPRAAFTSAPGTNAELVLGATGASTTANQLVAAKTRATTAGVPATTTVVTGDDILAIRGYAADGTNYIESARIELDTVGTVAATRVAGLIRFSTGTDAAPTVLTTALTLDETQQTIAAGNLISPNIRSLTTALNADVTTVAPSPRLAMTGAPGTNAQATMAATGASATANQFVAMKTRSTAADADANTIVVTGDDVLAIRGYGADGAAYIESSRIELDTEGTIALTRVPGVIRFSTGTDAAPTVLTTALTIDSTQLANFAGTVVTPNLRSLATALDATVTAVAPSPRLAASGAPGTNAQIAVASTGVSATAGQLVAMKTRATTAGAPATTVVVTGDDVLAIRGYGADGTNYIESSSIVLDTEGTVAATRVPGLIRFSTGTDAAPTVMTTALTINSAQLADFAGPVVTTTFRSSPTAPAATITAIAPAPRFFNASAPATNANFAVASGVASTVGAQMVAFKTRDTTAGAPATTTVVTADDILQLRGYGADGTNYIEAARIEFDTEGTIAATRVPGVIRFSTGTDAAPTVLTTALTIDSAQLANFAGVVVSPTIRASTTAPAATITAIAPAPRFFNATAPATNANMAFASGVASTVGAQLVMFKTRDTTAGAPATTTVVTGDDISQMRGYGADGTNYIEAARIEFDTEGTIAATRVPGVIRFSTGTDAAPTVLTTALTLDSAQLATFTGSVVAPNYRSLATALAATVTTVAPSPRMAATGAPGTNAQYVAAATGASATANQFVAVKTRATTDGAPATATVVTGDDIFAIRGYGADGTNYIEAANITMDTEGTIAATRVPGVIRFQTGTDAAPTVLTTALTIDSAQAATFTGTINAVTINRTAAALALQTTTSGNITLRPAAAATAAVTTNVRFQTIIGAAVASATNLTLGGDGNVFHVTGATQIDCIVSTGWQTGSVITLIFDSTPVVSDGAACTTPNEALKIGAAFTGSADDTMSLVLDGATGEWVELGRSVN